MVSRSKFFMTCFLTRALMSDGEVNKLFVDRR